MMNSTMDAWDWTQVALVVDYGQLSGTENATTAVAKLLETHPDFVWRGRDRMRRIICPEELTEHIIEGLRNSGLDIPEES